VRLIVGRWRGCATLVEVSGEDSVLRRCVREWRFERNPSRHIRGCEPEPARYPPERVEGGESPVEGVEGVPSGLLPPAVAGVRASRRAEPLGAKGEGGEE
jgi:hypothetical protein